MKFLFVSLACLVALSACASLSEDECRAGAWGDIGFADGAEGRGTDHIEKHRKACAEFGILPDQSDWLAGRTRGLSVYCTPAKAYAVGRSGRRIAPYCTAAALAAMEPAWDHGRQYWRIRSEIDDLERERRQIRADLSDLADTPENGGPRARLFSSLRFIDLDILRLEARLRRYESWPP